MYPRFVSECLTVLLIERTTKIVAIINMQRKSAIGSFAGLLNDGLHGQDRSGANVKRHLIEAGAQLDLFFVGVSDASSKVIPIARGKADVFCVHHFCRDWGDKKIATEENITIVAVKLLRLRVFEGMRPQQSN